MRKYIQFQARIYTRRSGHKNIVINTFSIPINLSALAKRVREALDKLEESEVRSHVFERTAKNLSIQVNFFEFSSRYKSVTVVINFVFDFLALLLSCKNCS